MSSRQNASGKRVAPAVPDLSRPLNRCMVKRPENGETKIQNGNQQLEFIFFFRGVLSNMGLSPLVPAFFFRNWGYTVGFRGHEQIWGSTCWAQGA